MLRLELHKVSVLTIGKLTLDFLPSRRVLILEYLHPESQLGDKPDLKSSTGRRAQSVKLLGLMVPLLEPKIYLKILLGELEEGRDMRFSRVLLRSPRMIKVSPTWVVEDFLVASSGWPFVSTVLGQMTHLVASLKLNSARCCVMQGSFLTQGKASCIPTIFSWGDNINPDRLLPSILLLLVIIVVVAIVVTVTLVVVAVGEGSSIIKLSFVIIGSLHRIVLCYLIH
ncbi:hypothetical protein Tco_0012332 [Tanacetum coccineum]